MYLDYAVATAAFVSLWVVLACFTNLSDTAQIPILCTAAVLSVLGFYPITRSAWTVLVYVSGGIDRPDRRASVRAIRGGKGS